MAKQISILILIFCSLNFFGQKRVSVLTSESYDKEKDLTTLLQVPYGNVDIPGKWTKTRYSDVSGQTFFVNMDTITIAIAKASKDFYPFYKKKQSDKDFVTEFYKWDSNYYKEKGFAVEQLADSSDSGYVIWKVTGKNLHATFLFGAKNKTSYNFATMTGRWDDKKSMLFLLDLFRKN